MCGYRHVLASPIRRSTMHARDPKGQRRNITMGAMALLAGLAFAHALMASNSADQFVNVLFGCVFLLILWAMYRRPNV